MNAKIKITVQVKRESEPRVDYIELFEGRPIKLNPLVLADSRSMELELMEPEPATDEPDK